MQSPESVVQLEFRLSDSTVPTAAATEMEGCQFILEEIIPRGEGRYVTYYCVEGCDLDRILELASEHETAEAQFLNHNRTGELLELLVTDDLPIMFLAAHGAFPCRMTVENGEMTCTVEVPPEYDASEIISLFKEEYPDAELTARRQQGHFTPLFSHREFEQAINDRLTDRQCEVLRVAYEEGYYKWPRDITGKQLSEKIGVSAATFHQHLRTAERKLVQLMFEEGSLRVNQENNESQRIDA